MSLGRPLRALFVLLGIASGCTATVTTGGSGGTCSADQTVTGCIGNSQGYSCTGGATPDEAVLNCSSGSQGNAGSTIYCCLPAGTSASTCAPDPTVTSCATGLAGYSCKSSDTPPESDPTLTCGPATPGTAGASVYCCSSAAAAGDGGTCAPDTSGAANCTGGAIGYACSGSLSPSTVNPMLSCGAGTPWMAGQSLFCCTTPVSPEAGMCAVGVSSGNAACDQCVDSACCSQLTACNTPDDAGTNGAGLTQCEALVQCTLDCLAGNPDAGVAPGTLGNCQGLCNPSYGSSEQAGAQAVIACETATCSTQCQ